MMSTGVDSPVSEHEELRTSNSAEDVRIVKIGCRKSELALVQAHLIISTLSERLQKPARFEIRTHSVAGDADKHTPFVVLAKQTGGSDAGKSLWTTGLEVDLVAGKSDFLIHCLKDMPTTLPPRCFLAAIPEREDPSDATVMRAGSEFKSMDDLPPGCVVGTSSSRRRALVQRNWPHLTVKECRGNVDTRVSKLDTPDSPFACIILATAGLLRLGLGDRITERLDTARFPYAVGQGALGVETCHDSLDIIEIVRHVDHIPSRWRGVAERAMLRHLQGGCSSPIGVFSSFEPLPEAREPVNVQDEPFQKWRGIMHLKATVLHIDGICEVVAESSSTICADLDAEGLGIAVANMLLRQGAQNLLIRQDTGREVSFGG